MKTLKTIQTLSKISKIFSDIIFICSIVGLCLSVAGIISLAFDWKPFTIGDITFGGVFRTPEDGTVLSAGDWYVVSAQGIVVCVGTIILSKFAGIYFKRELKDGTPFTSGGAKELLRLGILSVCIPIAEQIAASVIFFAVPAGFGDATLQTDLHTECAVTVGIAIIVTSLICRYGAGLAEEVKGSLPEGAVSEAD